MTTVRKKLLLATFATAALTLSAAPLPAMVFPDPNHCSTNVIDARETIVRDGCGTILWGETIKKFFS